MLMPCSPLLHESMQEPPPAICFETELLGDSLHIFRFKKILPICPLPGWGGVGWDTHQHTRDEWSFTPAPLINFSILLWRAWGDGVLGRGIVLDSACHLRFDDSLEVLLSPPCCRYFVVRGSEIRKEKSTLQCSLLALTGGEHGTLPIALLTRNLPFTSTRSRFGQGRSKDTS